MIKRIIRKVKAIFSKNEPLDFYYSADQEQVYRKSNYFSSVEFAKPVTYAKGKRYTEIVKAGSKPFGKFTDYKYVCSGNYRDIQLKGYY